MLTTYTTKVSNACDDIAPSTIHTMRYISNRNLGITMPAIYTMRVLKHKCKRGWNKTYTSYSSYTWSKYLSKTLVKQTSLVFEVSK
jgi:hypothetical protein